MAENHTQTKAKHPNKPVVMIGMMGAGKSQIGRELATRMALPFVDADEEITKAAGCSVSDIFELYGEDAFRDVESRVISRLLNSKVQIIATGGGAFINANIRRIIAKKGISLWLRVELDILIERTGRRGGRPLLKGNDAGAVLKKLMDERYPEYAEANIIIDSRDVPIQETVNETVAALLTYIENQTGT